MATCLGKITVLLVEYAKIVMGDCVVRMACHKLFQKPESLSCLTGVYQFPCLPVNLFGVFGGLLKNGCNIYLCNNWLRRNWKTSGGDPVKNRDLWERLHAAASRHQVQWIWVKGHAGHVENERVDVLARAAAEKFRIRDTVR